MQPQTALNIQQYLDGLEEIEKECAAHNAMCSTSLILHPNGSSAVEIDFLFTDRQGTPSISIRMKEATLWKLFSALL